MGEPIPTETLNSMNTVFTNSEYLITDRKFNWTLTSFRTGNDSIDHNFGVNEASSDNSSPSIDEILTDLQNGSDPGRDAEENPAENGDAG